MTFRLDDCVDSCPSPHQSTLLRTTSVGFTPAPSQGGLGSVLMRSADGRGIRSVLVDAQQVPLLMLECARTGTVAVQVQDLLCACSEGQVGVQAPETPQSWFKARSLYAAPCSSGQDVDLYRGKQEVSWSHVAVRPTAPLSGPMRSGFNLYVADPVLADRLAQSIASGGLLVRVAQTCIAPSQAPLGAVFD